MLYCLIRGAKSEGGTKLSGYGKCNLHGEAERGAETVQSLCRSIITSIAHVMVKGPNPEDGKSSLLGSYDELTLCGLYAVIIQEVLELTASYG